MSKNEIVLVKLGGSAITDKSRPRTINTRVLKQLAKELKAARLPLLISHGAGSFAHRSAEKYGGKKGYKTMQGIAQVASDVRELNFLVTQTLIKSGLPAISMSPMSLILTKTGEITLENFAIVEQMLSQGLIPVVYGDVLWDTTWKSTIFSGEKILNHIAVYLQQNGYAIKHIIQVGNTSGVYDQTGNTIPRITKASWVKMQKHITTSNTIDVTGGMRHKVEQALKLSQHHIPTILINGTKKFELLHALTGGNIQGTFIS